jgi:hypothetical protein
MPTSRILLGLMMAALLLVMPTNGGTQESYYFLAGRVTIDMDSVAAGAGFGSGSGLLRFDGKDYNFKTDGLSVGTAGVASVSAVGNVYNMTSISQFAGEYTAVGGGMDLASGAIGLTVQNQSGVIIDLYAAQQGVQLNIGPEGLYIFMQ